MTTAGPALEGVADGWAAESSYEATMPLHDVHPVLWTGPHVL